MAGETGNSSNSTPRKDCPVILHISDLHFGNDDPQEKSDRGNALNRLGARILGLDDKSWVPTHICITGDIGYKGKKEDYDLARKWLEALILKLEVPLDRVYMCPGNHDAERSIASPASRPKNADEVYDKLKIPLWNHFKDVFANFTDFQRQLGIAPYKVAASDGGESYLYGVRESTQYGLKFVCCNSCWYSMGDDDKDQLWLGARLLSTLVPDLVQRRTESTTVNLSLVHHPKEWLAEAEQRIHALSRGAGFNDLASLSHVILTGHTHEILRPWGTDPEGAYVCGGGAAWKDHRHHNAFRLIQVKHQYEDFVPRSFQWSPVNSEWEEPQLGRPCTCWFQEKMARVAQSQSVIHRGVMKRPKRKARQIEERVRDSILVDKPTKVPAPPALSGRQVSAVTERSGDVNRIAQNLVEEIRTHLFRKDHTQAQVLWQDTKEWVNKNRRQIDKELVEQFELLGEEIGLS